MKIRYATITDEREKSVRRRGRMKITFCRNWKIELGNFELRRSKSV